MLKQILFSVIALLFIVSCSSTREISEANISKSKKVNEVLKIAKSYMGTPYRYGEISKSGIDCSGLTSVAYNKYIKLPRTTLEQVKRGRDVNIRNVVPGDLLFFSTTRKKNSISHVGIVYRGRGNSVKFIHASTSRGVTTSSLRETYWKKSFVKARRIL